MKTTPFSFKNSLRLFFTGFTMGAADIVPGVSGGTVAFLLGIYEELIYSIKHLSGEFLRMVLRGKVVEAWKTIPFGFLMPLGLGLGTALVALSGLITFLLDTYPAFIWSFFFGLVLASAWVVRKRIVTWNLRDIVALVATTIATYFLVGAVPVETPTNYLTLFLSGAVAICAMILPGISGSFILVVLGKYEYILSSLLQRDILTLAVFAAGCVVGLAVFSRVLSYLFAKHHDILIAVLIGFMVGSLRKVWPWKEVLATRLNSHGELVPLLEKNVLPASLDTAVLLSIALAVGGFFLILFMERFEVTKEHTEDIKDPAFEKAHQKALRSQKSGKM